MALSRLLFTSSVCFCTFWCCFYKKWNETKSHPKPSMHCWNTVIPFLWNLLKLIQKMMKQIDFRQIWNRGFSQTSRIAAYYNVTLCIFLSLWKKCFFFNLWISFEIIAWTFIRVKHYSVDCQQRQIKYGFFTAVWRLVFFRRFFKSTAQRSLFLSSSKPNVNDLFYTAPAFVVRNNELPTGWKQWKIATTYFRLCFINVKWAAAWHRN